MNTPLLSICIPTYNRSTYLIECLDSIVSQLNNENLKKVEVIIIDNASTDNTTQVVKKFQEKFSNIKYFRNDKNIGFDRSFTKLIEKSTGKYCLSIGDDDAFFDGSIALITKELTNSTTPFYGLNNWGYDATLSKPVLPYPSLQLSSNVHFEKLSDYIHSIKKYTNIVGIFVGLSTQLFLREPWVAFNQKEKYFDTLAIHMYVNLSIFKNSPYTILKEPVIKTRSSNIRWDVFDGLGTIQGRLTSTLKIVNWIKKQYNLPISNISLYIYFYVREYWFTFKEIVKKILVRIGLRELITFYRKLR